MIFDTVNLAKMYFGLKDYDSTVVVLKISASSRSGGITERALSDELMFSRSSMNRILLRLVDLGHIEVISNTSPRRYVYTNRRIVHVHRQGEATKRRRAHFNVINRTVLSLLTIFLKMQYSQFDQPDK